MSKRFLFIVDPLESLNVATDTSLALMEEACARGVETFACQIKDIFLNKGELNFMAAPVNLTRGYKIPPHYLKALSPYSASSFNVVFMRKDPPVDQAFFTALLALDFYDPTKTFMLNSPQGILKANEKLYAKKIAKEFMPDTLVTCHKSLILDFLAAHERIVVKPLFQAGGASVMVFDNNDRNLFSALELMTKNYSSLIMVQEYIKDARLGDKRILLLGGEPLGLVLRVPHEDDHRANLHAGGNIEPAELSARDHEIVNCLRPHLIKMGLHFVGIDIVGGFLTEINVTSPTCLIEMEQNATLGEPSLRSKVFDYVNSLA